MATGVTPQLSFQVQKVFACDICEDEEEANWACNQCGQNLCDACKKRHSRTSYTKNHRVVSLLDRTEAGKENFNICKLHDEPHIFFCRVCRIAICAKCQAGKHSGHDVEELGSHSDTIRSAVDTNIREKRAAIEDSREKLSEYRTKFENYKQNSARNLSNLKENLDRLFIDLKREAKTAYFTVESHQTQKDNEMLREIQQAEAEIHRREQEVNECVVEVSRYPDAVLYEHVENHLSEKIREIKCEKTVAIPNVPTYDVGKEMSTIREAFGHMVSHLTHNGTDGNEWQEVAASSDAASEVIMLGDDVTLYSLVVIPGSGQAWFGMKKGDDLFVQQFTENGEILRIKYLSFPPLYMTVLKEQKEERTEQCHLLLSCGVKSSAIRMLKENGHIKDFFDFSPYFPFGLCTTDENDVIVCLQKADFPAKIVHLSSAGKVVKEEYLQDMYTPTRVVWGGARWVVKDYTSVVFRSQRDGKGYRTLTVNSNDCITCDHRGNILGLGAKLDSNDYHLYHLRQEDGTMITLQTFSFQESLKICGISLDVINNVLWIGTTSGIVYRRSVPEIL